MLLTEVQELPIGTPLLYARWILERGAISLFINRNQPDKFIPIIRAVAVTGMIEDAVEGPLVSLRSIIDGGELRAHPHHLHCDFVAAQSYLTKALQFKLNAIKIS